MHRRFILQLADGVPELKAFYRDAALAVTVPVWRCSGCLMAQGVYAATGADGRPQGEGCIKCVRMTWVPANRLASQIDGEVWRGFTHKGVHDLQPIMIAAVEGVILGGSFHRLTSSCENIIGNMVSEAVGQEAKGWLSRAPLAERHGRYRRCSVMFDYSIHVMTVTVHLAEYNPGATTQSFEPLEPVRVRYRWVQ